MSSSIRQIIYVLFLVILANLIFWPPRSKLVERRIIPLESSRKGKLIKNIDTVKPDVVLIGNSVLDTSVDPRQFSELTKTNTIKVVQGGSASAWWYLTLKNAVFKASHKPKLVALFFRDQFLTEPSFRIEGNYKKRIEQVAESEEPILDRLAYLGSVNIFTYSLLRYSPLYQKNDKVRTWFNSLIKDKIVSSTMRLEPGYVNNAIDKVLADENMDEKQLTARQLKVESNQNDSSFNFKAQLGKSFLPYMVKLAKEKNIQLVFVRLKKRRDVEQGSEPQKLKNYIQDLNAYLSDNDIPLVDFTHDERIKIDYFAIGDHYGDKGKKLFTQLLAEGMQPLLSNLKNTKQN